MNAYSLPTESMVLEERIRKLNRIGIALSYEEDLNKLLELILTEARGFTNADGGSLYVRSGENLRFAVAQTASLAERWKDKQPFESFTLPLTTESIAGYVALTGKVLNIRDVYRIPPNMDYRVNKQFDQMTGYRSKSMLVVPMHDHKNQVTGVLQLINSLDEDGLVIAFDAEYESLILSLASQAAVAIKNVELIEDIRKLFRSLVRYSATAIDARSPHTAGHSGRVAKYCVRTAHAINEATVGRFADCSFTAAEIEELRMAGWLHDIGKIGVRESVLEKRNKLTVDQLLVIGERFEGIRRGFENACLKGQLRLAEKPVQDSAPSTCLNDAMRLELKKLDKTLHFLHRVNVPGRMNEDDGRRLSEIARRTYKNSRGGEAHYLTKREYENLAVTEGNLTAAEFEEIKSHVNKTIDILEKIPFTKDLQNIPKHASAHHEYLDGTGYPKGLKGDEITLQARIMCVTDIFDALSSPDRPYKEAVPIPRALEILRQEARSGKLDPDVVDLFIKQKVYSGTADDDQ